MKNMMVIGFIVTLHFAAAQPNCNVYKLNGDDACFNACEIATEASEYEQGSVISQQKFDEAIKLCPSLAYAYFAKSIPYLKRGSFIEWKKIIDKAVDLSPAEYLGYRGWCRFQFLRDYQGAINDLEKLETILPHNIGYSQNGDYHLKVALALCYKAIDNKNKAIAIIEQHISQPDYTSMPYDYLHLGVLKYETGDLNGALSYLRKSIEVNDYLAEAYYYLALVEQTSGNIADFKINMGKAHEYYLKGYRRFDHYTNPADKIFLSDIERELGN